MTKEAKRQRRIARELKQAFRAEDAPEVLAHLTWKHEPPTDDYTTNYTTFEGDEA